MVRFGGELTTAEICKRLDRLENDKGVREYLYLKDTLRVRRELLKQKIRTEMVEIKE